MSLTTFATSVTGKNHAAFDRPNEDRFLVADLTKMLRVLYTNVSAQPLGHLEEKRGLVMAVADGVSGAQRGAESSELASDILTGYLLHTLPWFVGLRPPDEHFSDELRRAFRACHGALVSEGREWDNSYATTLTLAYVAWRRLYVANVGDSRCYVKQGSQLKRTTTDQTVAQELVEREVIAPEAADDSPFANILTSALGAESDLNVDVVRVHLNDGDRIMLSSDGVHGSLTDDQIAEILENQLEDEAACRALIDLAVESGSSDDATCIVATFVEDDDGVQS